MGILCNQYYYTDQLFQLHKYPTCRKQLEIGMGKCLLRLTLSIISKYHAKSEPASFGMF